jgi:chromosome segregation ATPase
MDCEEKLNKLEERVEARLDRIDEKLGVISTALGVYNAQLGEHMRRTEVAEKRLDLIDTEIKGLHAYLYKALGALAVIGPAVSFLADKLFG